VFSTLQWSGCGDESGRGVPLLPPHARIFLFTRSTQTLNEDRRSSQPFAERIKNSKSNIGADPQESQLGPNPISMSNLLNPVALKSPKCETSDISSEKKAPSDIHPAIDSVVGQPSLEGPVVDGGLVPPCGDTFSPGVTPGSVGSIKTASSFSFDEMSHLKEFAESVLSDDIDSVKRLSPTIQGKRKRNSPIRFVPSAKPNFTQMEKFWDITTPELLSPLSSPTYMGKQEAVPLATNNEKQLPKKKRHRKESEKSTYTVEKILEMKKKKGVRMFLVKWKGYGHSQNTWEPESNFLNKSVVNEFLSKKKQQNKNAKAETHQKNMKAESVAREREKKVEAKVHGKKKKETAKPASAKYSSNAPSSMKHSRAVNENLGSEASPGTRSRREFAGRYRNGKFDADARASASQLEYNTWYRKDEDPKYQDAGEVEVEEWTEPLIPILRGKYYREDKNMTVVWKGKWAMSRQLLEDGVCSDFMYKCSVTSPAEQNTHIPTGDTYVIGPVSGLYSGSFDVMQKDGSQPINVREVGIHINFRPKQLDARTKAIVRERKQVVFDVTGRGKNEVGPFQMKGSLVLSGDTNNGVLELDKKYQSKSSSSQQKKPKGHDREKNGEKVSDDKMGKGKSVSKRVTNAHNSRGADDGCGKGLEVSGVTGKHDGNGPISNPRSPVCQPSGRAPSVEGKGVVEVHDRRPFKINAPGYSVNDPDSIVEKMLASDAASTFSGGVVEKFVDARCKGAQSKNAGKTSQQEAASLKPVWMSKSPAKEGSSAKAKISSNGNLPPNGRAYAGLFKNGS